MTTELYEHAIAHAARVLRESGATPAQVNVGIQLALGKTKPVIADKLGVQLSSVVDVTKIYQTLDVHNPAELSDKNLAGPKSRRAAPRFARRINRALLLRSGLCHGTPPFQMG